MMNTPKANLPLKNQKLEILNTKNKNYVTQRIKFLLKLIKLQIREENQNYNNQWNQNGVLHKILNKDNKSKMKVILTKNQLKDEKYEKSSKEMIIWVSI